MNRQLDNYVHALIPDTYKVLGVELRPFSLGHIFLMYRYGSGFILDEPVWLDNEKDLIGHLVLAVCICSRTYEDFLEFVSNEKELHKWVRKLGKKIKWAIRKQKLLNIIFKRKRHYNFYDDVELLKNYIKNNMVFPKYWEVREQDGTTSSGTHWTQAIKSILITKCNYNEHEALNAPMLKAIADYFKYLEENGIITLMRDDEIESIEKAEVQHG